MPDFEQLLYTQDGRVVTLTLNRPERLNAWTGIMETELIRALRHASDDDSVGCIVITGAGRGFCSGADVGGWAKIQSGEVRRPDRAPALVMSDAREASPNVPLTLFEAKPVIAAINGPAVGIGLTMAMACDIRIASDRARFSARFVRVGLVPECGGTHNIAAVAGIESALELILTGRIINATDPLAQKLVSRIVPHDELLPTAYALAREIASGPTDPVWLAKRLVRRNAAEQDMHRVVAGETQIFPQLKDKPAHREAVSAFMEKREPNFH
ncbi:MAG: enoyl-CoA hydratase/isomerase family protein [Dehalococcoidia bacterium]|nr:enoyl-CoA hydratase/isomerase family protein [Dehalococcoidia bacterium]